MKGKAQHRLIEFATVLVLTHNASGLPRGKTHNKYTNFLAEKHALPGG